MTRDAVHPGFNTPPGKGTYENEEIILVMQCCLIIYKALNSLQTGRGIIWKIYLKIESGASISENIRQCINTDKVLL